MESMVGADMNDQNLQTKQRKPWIDALRALAILFVMYGHLAAPKNAYYVFTSPIKIPLFFAISGYVFNHRNGNVKAFLSRMLRSLVIPWLLLSISQVVLFIPDRGFGYVGPYILRTLTGELFWYMPCCILAEILLFLQFKLLKKHGQVILSVLSLTVVGLWLSRFPVFDTFKFGTALIAQSYLLIGYSIRRNEHHINKIKIGWLIAGVMVYILLGLASLRIFPGQSLDVNTNSYYNLPWCAVMIVLGCFLLFALGQRLSRYPKFLTALGQNTLVLYLFHTNVLAVLATLGFALPDNWWGGFVKVIVSCVACGIIAALLNWLLPEAVGKKRKAKTTV